MKIQHKIKCYVFLIALSFLCVSKVYASLEITEIMYAPNTTDHNYEWVEIKNTGDSQEDLSKWKFYSSGKRHDPLIPISQNIIDPGGYAVIIQTTSNLNNDPKFVDLLITRSSWTDLKNTSDNVGLIDPVTDSVVSEYIYDSALTNAEDNGNSLQKINGDWVASFPTPGVENILSNQNNNTTDDTDTTDSIITEEDTTTNTQSSSGSSSKNDEPKIIITKAQIIGKNVAVAGLALPLDSLVTNNRGITFAVGRFVWNFGDGTKIENTSNQKLTHTYWYPGDYVLTLSFYKGHNIEPDGVDRMILKVIPSGVYVSSVGGVDDPYIELENKSSYEIDLSNWIIQSTTKTFVIPEGMILLPNKKIKLSSRITGFNIGDIGFFNIINSNGETMATYPNKIIYNSKSNSSSSSNIKSPSASSNNIDNSNINEESNIINLNDLEASAVKSSMNLNINYYLVALFFVIGAGIASVLLLRKKNDINHDNDGVEGSITANDIRIIE